MKSIPAEETVLITGASSGIGYQLCREFARNGHSLVIVAPVADELEALARLFTREFGVPVHAIACDLRNADADAVIASRLSALGIHVSILANNAGLGRHGKFWEMPLDDDITMIRLNIEAVIRLTKRFLPAMIARGHGRILNTASVAGFQPGPLLAVYHATKAFVLSWSEALATELQGTGVTLTALCPGPVDTDFFTKAEMIDTHAFQDTKMMAPQDVATAAYKALMEAERIIVPGSVNKAMVFGGRFMSESAQAKVNEKLYSNTDPADRKRERGEVEAAASDRDR